MPSVFARATERLVLGFFPARYQPPFDTILPPNFLTRPVGEATISLEIMSTSTPTANEDVALVVAYPSMSGDRLT